MILIITIIKLMFYTWLEKTGMVRYVSVEKDPRYLQLKCQRKIKKWKDEKN